MGNALDVRLQYQFFPAFVALGAVAGVVFIKRAGKPGPLGPGGKAHGR